MDLRLLITALLLACNAGYLIWKAKTNPRGRSSVTRGISNGPETPVTEIVIRGAQKSAERGIDGLRSSLKSDLEKPLDKLERR
jgi:hypothetical protein